MFFETDLKRYDILKRWVATNYDREQLEMMLDQGLDSGWSGISYNSECMELYRVHSDAIWAIWDHKANLAGHHSALREMADEFEAQTKEGFECYALWGALEYVSKDILGLLEED